MGTLLGHILPGTFFILFAFWWLIAILRKYYRSRYYGRPGEVYTNTAMQTCFCCLPKIPLEGILKVVACSIGIAGEAVTGFQNGKWAHKGNAQHISMFMFFGFSGIMDILYFYKFTLPDGLDYAAALIAFTMEGLLFANHLHGRSHMDVMVHTYLLYAIIGCVICVGLEAKFRESTALAIGRTYFSLIQGTWFWQIGFILYPPAGMSHWDEEDHVQMMQVTTIFSWHFAAAAAVILFTMIITNQVVKRSAPDDERNGIKYQKIGMGSMNNKNIIGAEEARPITSNGTALRHAFDETSEDEV